MRVESGKDACAHGRMLRGGSSENIPAACGVCHGTSRALFVAARKSRDQPRLPIYQIPRCHNTHTTRMSVNADAAWRRHAVSRPAISLLKPSVERHKLLADSRVYGDGGLEILQVENARTVNLSNEHWEEAATGAGQRAARSTRGTTCRVAPILTATANP